MNLDKLSSYQNPEGKLQDRLAPRTDLRLSMIVPRWFHKKTVLDIGCNNGYFTRLAMKSGATRAVGVDKSDCIEGARELAKEEGVGAEFWQLDVESKEFQSHSGFWSRSVYRRKEGEFRQTGCIVKIK